MELFFNDLSLSGQLPDSAVFRDAIDRIMVMRELIHRFGKELYCHRNMVNARVTQGMNIHEAVGCLGRDQQRVIMRWLTMQGPFWDDERDHTADDYMEQNGEVVTDTALGEAAFRCYRDDERRLLSLVPSQWDFTPIQVLWHKPQLGVEILEVINYWEKNALQRALETIPVPIASWKELEHRCTNHFRELSFADDCFRSLTGVPFCDGAARRVFELLKILEKLRTCHGTDGERNEEGNEIYQNFFVGEKALFTDSSAWEKSHFQNELTFRHPTIVGSHLFCPWHGKVKTPQIRVHFSWPVPITEPLFVVYVGPKKTKR